MNSAIKASHVSFFAVVLIGLMSIGVKAETIPIKHIEPLSWWVGMNNPQLQLMVNGENISALAPVIDYPGVQVVNTETTDNNNYLFINLRIAENAKPGSFTINFKQGDVVMAKATYRLDTRAKNSSERRGFDASDAIDTTA